MNNEIAHETDAMLHQALIKIRDKNNSKPYKNNTKPNIIYILADDAGMGDVSAYNPNSKIPTPNIDSIAAQGIKFTDAHTPSSVCTPTRYSILTGRYSWRTRLKKGVLRGYDPALIEEGRETVASLLQKQGYKTAGIGKWHLGLGDNAKTDYSLPLIPGPMSNGFDYYYGIPASLDMPPYVYFENDKVLSPADFNIGDNGIRRGIGGGEGYWRGGKIAQDYNHIEVLPNIANKTVSYINNNANSEQPFFIYMPLPAPHQPWLPTQEFKDKSEAGAYGDFMVQVDSVVGQVLQAVENNSIAQNTLIIFTSDNGSHWYDFDIEKYEHHANLHYRGHKGDIYEGGHRVPFVAKWPLQIPAGKTSHEIVSLTDLMATVAAITQTEMPSNSGEDSYNILPALLQIPLAKPIRDVTIMHSMNGTFAIRKGDWKLIAGPNSGGFGLKAAKQYETLPQVQLFNLATDPSETNNVFDQYREKVNELSSLLAKTKAM
jgi:arylsulfatase A-like enzyme